MLKSIIVIMLSLIMISCTDEAKINLSEEVVITLTVANKTGSIYRDSSEHVHFTMEGYGNMIKSKPDNTCTRDPLFNIGNTFQTKAYIVDSQYIIPLNPCLILAKHRELRKTLHTQP